MAKIDELLLDDSDNFNEISNQFDSLEKDLSAIASKTEVSSSSVLASEEEIEEETEDKNYYFLVPPDKNLAKSDVFRIFEKMEEVVPGQLILSVYDLSGGERIDKEFKAGNNIAMTPDGKQYYSTVTGQVCWIGNVISVEKTKKINGDLTAFAGNTEYDTSLIVNGNIQDDVKIKVNGDLYVLENIGKAEIEVNG
ncbi:MAG TPA: FapA family protein, partial [bacterium]|nr:FapA family protein [bacterium]